MNIYRVIIYGSEIVKNEMTTMIIEGDENLRLQEECLNDPQNDLVDYYTVEKL